MSDKPLLQKDTADGASARTSLQVIPAFFVGLALTIWQVPGVPEAIGKFSAANGPGVLLALGLAAGGAAVVGGTIAFIWNVLRGKKPV